MKCAASFIKPTSYLRNGEVTCGDINPNRFQVRSRYPQVCCKPGVKLSEIAEREYNHWKYNLWKELAWLLSVCLPDLLEFFEKVNKPVDKGDLANIVCLDL